MMKKLLSLVLVLGLLAVVSVEATGQIKKGKTRPLTTKQLMSGLVKPQCAELGEGLKSAPTDDKGWEALKTKGALLNEVSYLLMDDDRCPDATWANAAKALREGTTALLSKLEAKDGAGAADAFKAVSASCGDCHKAHKK